MKIHLYVLLILFTIPAWLVSGPAPETAKTRSSIQQLVPKDMVPYIKISLTPTPKRYMNVNRALEESMRLIKDIIHFNKTVDVIIGTSPFVLDLPNGSLVYEFNNETVNSYIHQNIIFLDYKKIHKLPYELQVACILEEFVHAFMNIRDERTAYQVVSLLYEGVDFDGKMYSIHDKDND